MRLSLDTMSPRERRLVVICALIGVLVVVFGVIMPLDRSVSLARARIGQKQADLVWMKNVAPVLATAGPVAGGASGESLIVIIDRSARESGLGSALGPSQPSGPGGIRVRLEKAPFDAIIGWLARLSQQNGIRVDGATIDNAGSPGIVNADLVLQSR